jgi:hypothetical protein
MDLRSFVKGIQINDFAANATMSRSNMTSVPPPLMTDDSDDVLDGAVLVHRTDAGPTPDASPISETKAAQPSIEVRTTPPPLMRLSSTDDDVGPFTRPFLAVVMDPRAAGPLTLVALRALFRLLTSKSLLPTLPASFETCLTHHYTVSLEPLTKGVLACKFEQTDAGADEAVEMAIADLLALLVKMDRQRSLKATTLMDAFNTVFVTRNTFVHSPALCYHFEDVLCSIVTTVFGEENNTATTIAAAHLILEFLVNQLLHTPLVGDVAALDEAAREAKVAHDATRVLCLRLARCALQTGWGNSSSSCILKLSEQQFQQGSLSGGVSFQHASPTSTRDERSLLQLIQDDFCLSLLMTGQAIWAYHDASSTISPGFISLEVLSEICNTLSTLWNTIRLRRYLTAQFETIFAGFYQRALVLLRKRPNPTESMSFHANLVFDAEVEIILESLVDILCLHDHEHSVADGDGGALETLFASYDCHMRRSDVASGLMIELCRCCGGAVGEEGLEEGLALLSSPQNSRLGTPGHATPSSGVSTPMRQDSAVGEIEPVRPNGGDPFSEDSLRIVPAHLKELCAEALVGAMKCLFRDDKACEQTLAERARRGSIILRKAVGPSDQVKSTHSLRDVKSKKLLMRKAALMFNQKSRKGIEFLVSSGLVPDPVTPRSVAAFLRNGIVVGLDKRAVGAYLGEVGKGPAAGKSPPSCERDWFHKEVLTIYCSLFRFERQSVLDCLRMFLSAFRLPGEAQQIDRILQAFADTCSQVCEESMYGHLKLFSDDHKRASDAAYLLSFSIIMLNTDQHNDNIREDRKMSLGDFVKNNTDYGRDITEKGKEFPREYLQGIYESIRDEAIRTEGEGAEGHMTVERWKDVLRGSAAESDDEDEKLPSTIDAEDLTELVLEHVWMPIMSATAAFWGISKSSNEALIESSMQHHMTMESRSGMLAAQGARLGMDMALEMLNGVRALGRIDLFRKMFTLVCSYTGLLAEYKMNAVEKTWLFSNSIQAQSAVIVAIRVARDAGDAIGADGWRCVFSIIFELRDLKMLGGGVTSRRKSLLNESDPDLLQPQARREWIMRLVKGDVNDETERQNERKGVTSMLGAFGRVLFGGGEPVHENSRNGTWAVGSNRSDFVVWDELAPSDDEDDVEVKEFDEGSILENVDASRDAFMSAGAQFENQLIHEDLLIYQNAYLPITGLERVEDTRRYKISPRGRVRKRLARSCDFAALIADSRFLDLDGIFGLLQALLDIIAKNQKLIQDVANAPVTSNSPSRPEGAATSASDIQPMSTSERCMLSPASEALAEVLICEVALKNRDRLGFIWKKLLRDHYHSRLLGDAVTILETKETKPCFIKPGIEKCITGLLRICACAMLRDGVANDIVISLNLLVPTLNEWKGTHPSVLMEKHLGEGLWRMCRSPDGLIQLDSDGWESLLALVEWCATRGGKVPSPRLLPLGRPAGLAEDDPAFQAFRSLHLILNTPDSQRRVPFTVVRTISTLIATGERRNCPKLSIAGLDLLHLVSTRGDDLGNSNLDRETHEFWSTRWRPVMDGMVAVADTSVHSVRLSLLFLCAQVLILQATCFSKCDQSVRQHALSMLTDSFLDKHGSHIPTEEVCKVLIEVCIPLASRRLEILWQRMSLLDYDIDEVMIEFELCIGLIFKPLLHHLQNIQKEGDLILLWKCVLSVLETLFNDEPDVPVEDTTRRAELGKDDEQDRRLIEAKNLAHDHLRNAIMVLIGCGVLHVEPEQVGDLTDITWDAINKISFAKRALDEWKKAAMKTT